MPITHQREPPKLHLALALTLGICIHNYSALILAVSAEKVEIPGKVDFFPFISMAKIVLKEKPIESQVHMHSVHTR